MLLIKISPKTTPSAKILPPLPSVVVVVVVVVVVAGPKLVVVTASSKIT